MHSVNLILLYEALNLTLLPHSDRTISILSTLISAPTRTFCIFHSLNPFSTQSKSACLPSSFKRFSPPFTQTDFIRNNFASRRILPTLAPHSLPSLLPNTLPMIAITIKEDISYSAREVSSYCAGAVTLRPFFVVSTLFFYYCSFSILIKLGVGGASNVFLFFLSFWGYVQESPSCAHTHYDSSELGCLLHLPIIAKSTRTTHSFSEYSLGRSCAVWHQ